MSPQHASAELLHPELRQHLARYLRHRLPPAEVDDALQAVYCAALEARNVPHDEVHLRKWMTVIARRQVAAYYERSNSEQLGEPPEIEVQAEFAESQSLLRWAEKQAAHSKLESVEQTLDWMARESDGEKLESIAADSNIPSANVRQRVSRLRRFMKERWILEMSAAVALIAIASWLLTRRSPIAIKLEHVPLPNVSAMLPEPTNRAAEIRQSALRHCNEDNFPECLRLLDEAKTLDPKGDSDSIIVDARKRAADRMTPPTPTSSAPAPIPTTRKAPVTPTRTRSSGTPSSPFSSSGM